MSALRLRLSSIASVWLCCQLAVLTAAPVSLFAHAPQAADAVTCTCTHTGNAQCPMHHQKSQPRGCECRNTTDPDAASIVSLLGPIAVLAAAPARIEPPPITKLPIYPINEFADFVPVPVGPPPRA